MTGVAVRIAIVDDHPLFRSGVARSLTEIGGFKIVGEGGTADDATRLAAAKEADILLLDISMPGGGLAAAASILSINPQQKIVMLTVSETNSDVVNALSAGARGYVLKGVRSGTLAEILHDVMAGQSYLSPSLSANLVLNLSKPSNHKRDLLQALSTRESQILLLVSEGNSNKEIANRLGLQEKTVKHHMTRLLAKLKVRNRTEAAVLMHEINTFHD